MKLGYTSPTGATTYNRFTWAIILTNLPRVETLRASVGEGGGEGIKMDLFRPYTICVILWRVHPNFANVADLHVPTD